MAPARALGFGAHGRSNAVTRVGDSNVATMEGATTVVAIGASANVTGLTVALRALVPSLVATANSESYGAGFYSEGIDDATAQVDATTNVTIGANAAVTGYEGVDLQTRYGSVHTFADSFARSTGLFGYVDADGRNTTNLDSTVTGAAGALVTAGPGPRAASGTNLRTSAQSNHLAFYVDTQNGALFAGSDGHVSRRSLAAGSGDEHGSNLDVAIRIPFSSDVLILSGRTPVLVVDASGTITTAVEVTVNDGPGRTQIGEGQTIQSAVIVVNDISNAGPGDVVFRAPYASGSSGDFEIQSAISRTPEALVSGVLGTWTFRDTLSQVLITNLSNKLIQINDIHMVSTRQPLVWLDTSANVTIRFNVRGDSAPSLVDIRALGTGAVAINGTIDNAIGTTSVLAATGAITSTASRGVVHLGSLDAAGAPQHHSLIRTNILRLDAASVGSPSTRVNVDIVDAAALPRGSTFATRRVVVADDTITLGPDMVFFRGQVVRYDAAPGATAIGGLVSGSYYYAIPTADGTGVQLAATSALVPLALTPGETATLLLQLHALTPVQRFTVTADADAFLDILGVQRIATATDFTVVIDAVTTGGDADLLLQPSVRETPTGATSGVLVKWPSSPSTGVVHRVYFTPDSSCPADCARPASGAGGTFLAQTDSTYDLRARDLALAGAPYVLPGIVAGGNIIVEAAQPTATSPRTINVFGIVDVLTTGHVDVLTNGWITLNEHVGDLRVGRILSTLSDVLLHAPGRIVDALGGLAGDTKNGVVADVSGGNITMCAGSGLVLDGAVADPLCSDIDLGRGGIGDTTNFLEIDVAHGTGTNGVLRAFDRTATSGHGIFVTETIGALRLFEVNTLGDVALTTVAGSIIDARSTTPGTTDVAQVYGNTIDLDANGTGAGIGAADNDLEIESQHSGAGDVGLEANGSIWLTETRGPLALVLAEALGGLVRITVRETAAANPTAYRAPTTAPPSLTGNVTFDGATITRTSGSFITDGFLADTGLRISGGTPYDGDYSIVDVTATRLTLSATLWAHDDVRSGVTIAAHDTLDEDLALLHDGLVRFVETGERTVPRGRIAAAMSVLLRVGDDVTTTPNSQVLAGTTLDIFGDWSNGDAHWGTTIVLRGDVTSGNGATVTDTYATNVWGHTDLDRFELGDATGLSGGTAVDSPGYIHLGSDTRIHGSHSPAVAKGADGEDRFTIWYLQTMNVGAGHTLVLDGQAETDTYRFHTSGSRGSSRNYVAHVLDTGAPDDGVDELYVYGIDSATEGYSAPGTSYPVDDLFLLRRVTAIAGETADRPAFVALLHTTLATAAPTGISTLADDAFGVERIGYDTAVNGRVTVHGLGGNDYFASDDTSAITTLDGGSGNDSFQIGQIYGLQRDGSTYTGTTPTNTTGVTTGGSLAADDLFGTVATTRGWLSRGNSQALLARGGTGDDTFVVYSNQAALRLEGDDGNDQFVVRAFALARTDAHGEIVWRDRTNQVAMPLLGASLFSTAATTEVRTGAGNNQVQYTINAPVSIDGGKGIDKVVVLGTEFADHIVVTSKAVYGAGLAVTYANVEILEIDGLEGDDLFDVLSTAPGVATRVIGGLGSDVINVAGDVAGSVVSRDIEGTSGTVNHDVSSTNPLYDGLAAPGVDTIVARGTQGQVIIEETGGFTAVREGEGAAGADSYLVYLAQKPTANVYVTVSAPPSSSAEAAAGGDTIHLAQGIPVLAAAAYDRMVWIDGQLLPVPAHAVVLLFTPTAWDRASARTISLMAANDSLPEGTRVVVISHSVISADAVFDHAVVRNVEATIRDNDLPAVELVEQDHSGAPDNTTILVEGTSTTGLKDTVLVRLATDPGADVVVRLTLSDDRMVLTAPAGTIDTVTARAPGVAGVYDITIKAGQWQTGVLVTLVAVDDFVRQDPHTTTITATSTYAGALAARIDALLHDDETPGIVVIESGGRTLVVAGDTTTGPGPGDSYEIRPTQNPGAGTPVNVAIVTDGQTDVVTSGRVSYQAIGGETAYRQFSGSLTLNGSTLTRSGDSALGNFRDEGFAAGQRIRLTVGSSTYDYVIGSVSADGKSLTLILGTTPTPPAAALPAAVLSRIVTRGLYTGDLTYDAATGTVHRTDGQSWLDAGFLEGQLVTIGSSAQRYKIQLISSSTSGALDLMTLTTLARPPTALSGILTVMQWAAVVTFDSTNWWQPVTVDLVADPYYVLQPGQENLTSFSKRPHLLSGIRGPLAVEGGTTASDRSLRPAVLLPGEGNAPLFQIAPQPPEAQQVDVLNVYADSSQEDLRGTLTATAITGLGMNSTPLDFSALVASSGGAMPFGEPTTFPAGISYGAIVVNPLTGAFDPTAAYTTIEVLNLLLGQGNDHLDITSTLVPGPDHNADGSLGSVAVHGGITTVHGGGNSLIQVIGTFSRPSATTLRRNDGVSWASAGFVVGQVLTVNGTVVGTVSALSGDTLTITGGSFAAAGYTGATVAARDPKTGSTRIGGDTIVITGGAGPNSPLVVHGDTSQDGRWYGGDPRVQSFLAFGTKPFPDEIGNGDSRFVFPVANPFVYAGHDVIDASALFAGVASGALPTVGVTAYGGAGDDTILGSAAPDFLAGGSGDDLIVGGRGSDQIHGDNGVDVDVITRELSIPWRNASVFANRDGLEAGQDTLHGDGVGSTGATTDEYDDIIFGDYGSVRQDTAEATLGVLVPGTSPSDTVYGYSRPTRLERIQTAGRVREIRTERAEDGAHDVITGDGGRDRIFGGNGDDTISGDGQSDVVFGDHGRMLYLEGTASVTILHLVESITEKQGGADTITSGLGDDIVAGGARGDTIDAGVGQNIVFGDHGRVTGVENNVFNRPMPSTLPPTYPHDDHQVPVLQLVEGYVPTAGEFGGADVIRTGLGRDMVFGGAAGDTIVVNSGETPTALDGNNIVFGDYGYVDYLLGEGTTADTTFADDAHDIEVVSSYAASTSLGGGDTITAGAGNDIIVGGVGNDVLTAGQGKNLTFGDSARLSTNPALPDTHLSSFSVHEFLICIIETFGFGDLDGGDDTIYGSEARDILFGGAGNDVIHGYGGDDLIFGDQGRVTCTTTSYDPDDPRNGLCVDLGGTIDFRATNVTTHTGSGNDVVFAGSGNDIVMGQQGDDLLYGEGGDDLLIGGSNVSGALDGNDLIDGGSGNDLIAGDNADCCRRPDLLDPRMRALLGSTIHGTSIPNGTDGHTLVTGTWQNDPRGGAQYSVTLLDHSDSIQANRPDLWGDDHLAGGAGDDEIFGQLGHDVIQGDGAIDGLVLVPYAHDITAADARPVLLLDGPNGTRVGAWRLADPTMTLTETLVVHASVEQATDGDDYIEGNGGADTIFGNLGQDDIVGDSSDLYGLGNDQRVTISTRVVGATTFLKDSTGKPVAWRVVGISADGLTLLLAGSAAGLPSGVQTVTIHGPGIEEPLEVTITATAGGISLLATVDWRTIGSFCLGPQCRPAGADLVFGGAGTDITRNDPGDATLGSTGIITTVATGHARDADVIAGDNARILRLVGTFGVQRTPNAYLTYAYDTYAGGLRLVPRAVELLDYTFGGPAFNAASAATDRGAADEFHGESGDDQIYGMTGNDVLYGDGQDDDLIGGYGDDWISGGTGDDGILGDDGRISTSRNSSTGWTAQGVPCTADGTTCYAEPLYGILALFPTDPNTRTSQGNVLNEVIYTPGHVQEETVNVAGVLNKSVNLTPFNVDPADLDPLFRPEGGYDDIIFGGLGDDAIHGGSGDDALSGAEALVAGYAPKYVTSCGAGTTPDCTAVRDGLVRIDFGHPVNPGDVLRYNPDDVDGWHYDRTRRAGEFDLYDEYEPRRAILFNDAAEVWTCTSYSPSGHTCTGNTDVALFPHQFFLNNVWDEGPTILGCVDFAPNGSCLATGGAQSDGNDVLFGDLGNDWVVGGTGHDTLWGGWGNDLLQADDVLGVGCTSYSNSGTCLTRGESWLNDSPDTHPMYEDRAFGGAGRDVLIGNTGGDRLIDWTGEFNSYIVPFAPFGIATVSRQVPPALFEFLYRLSAAQGADPTRAADWNLDFADRNGEPYGEIGLITQQDHGLWQDQSGAPADPQAGNIPGGKRDVLRSATFNDGKMSAVAIDSGVWDITGGALDVSAGSLGGDAAAVFYVDQTLPVYYELLANVKLAKPTSGWKANAFVIFDYFSASDFKFAGLDQSTNKVVMGHRTAAGWMYDVQAAVGNVRADSYYALQVTVDGLVVTVHVDGVAKLTYQFDPRFVDGQAHGLNMGLVGFGSDNARGTFDDLVIQALPPQTTYVATDDFATGAGRFTGATRGTWTTSGGRLTGTAGATSSATRLMELPVRAAGGTTTSIDTTVRLSVGGSGGMVFDHYADNDFKFLTLDQASALVVVGHVIRNRRVVDATFAASLPAGTDLRIALTLSGTTVTVWVGGLKVGSYSFNGAVGDGTIGALAERGTTSLDDVHVVIGVNVNSSPDRVAPMLSLPPNVTTTAGSGATTTYVSDATLGTATATDNVPGVVVTRTGVPSGYLFTLGTTTLTWTATDVFGNQTVGTQTVTVTAPAPTPAIVTVAATDSAGAEAAGNPIVFTVTRSGDTTVPLTVSVSLGGTASAGDYGVIVTGGALSGSTLTFAAGSSTATVRVTAVDDSQSEPTESVTLTIGAGSGYTTSGATTVSGSITDNDAPPAPVVPALSIADVTVLEGASPGYVLVTVALSSPAPSAGVTVQVRSAYGSADRKDFSTVNQSVTIAGGLSSATVTVWITNDRTREGTESFTLSLSSPLRATIADGTALITILDDESALLAAQSPAAVNGTSSAHPLTAASVVGATRAALREWAALGRDASTVAEVAVHVTDLPDTLVGYAGNGLVELDVDAAGQGWTPELLVAAVVHELGHLMGLGHAALAGMLDAPAPATTGSRLSHLTPKSSTPSSLAPSAQTQRSAAAGSPDPRPLPHVVDAPAAPVLSSVPGVMTMAGSRAVPASAAHPAGQPPMATPLQPTPAVLGWHLLALLTLLLLLRPVRSLGCRKPAAPGARAGSSSRRSAAASRP
jgi:Ca2+-binding RTX toxin-like protein